VIGGLSGACLAIALVAAVMPVAVFLRSAEGRGLPEAWS
jgi:hypothetical protein